MTDWATRVSTRDNPLSEMQPPQSELDVEATVSAIRRLVEENADLLPEDIAPAHPEAGEVLTMADDPDRRLARAALLPALVPAEDTADTPRRGLLAMLRGFLH